MFVPTVSHRISVCEGFFNVQLITSRQPFRRTSNSPRDEKTEWWEGTADCQVTYNVILFARSSVVSDATFLHAHLLTEYHRCTDKRPPSWFISGEILISHRTMYSFIRERVKNDKKWRFFLIAVVYSKFLLNLQTSRKFRPIYLRMRWLLFIIVHYVCEGSIVWVSTVRCWHF